MKTLAIALVAVVMMVGGCSADASRTMANQPTERTPYTVDPVDNSTSDAIRHCNRKAGSGVLLSFDDSGTPKQVNATLDKLDQYKIQAAFFPTGEWALEHLDLIERMKRDGHIVGNHTQSHARLGELSANDPDKFYAETYPLENVANTDPMWLRPPYEDGAYDELVAERLTEKNVQLCTWTADTHDWDGSSVDQMMARLTKGDKFSPEPLGEDGVVLAHLHGEHNPALIDALMTHLEEKNLKVAPLHKK